MKDAVLFITVFLFVLFTASVCSSGVDKKKILFIDSYHEEYIWSANVTSGINSVLADRDDVGPKVFRFDTKRNQSEQYKNKATLRARDLIETWHPDVVIASDDDASKYLIVPHFKGQNLPFVFCDLNGEASAYSLPSRNITGMVEVAPTVSTTRDMLKHFVAGDRIGSIGGNLLSKRKDLKYLRENVGVQFTTGSLVTDFEEWEKHYLSLQENVDVLLWLRPTGIKGWDDDKAEEFILQNNRIPTGAIAHSIMRFAGLLDNLKIAEEQGWCAGNRALTILAGMPPSDIPLAAHKESAINLNMKPACKLDIKFPMELIEKAGFLKGVST
jgi:ABC-type uncharacterized transport system substrate-binding protein